MDCGISALEAMELSEKEDRIVHMRYSEVLHADLFADCDDYTEDNVVSEYWTDTWRVHLHK